MAWRGWFRRALGGDDEAGLRDPDERRELVTVAAFEAPLLVADLADHDIEATTQDAFDLVTKSLTNVRVLVRHGDLDAAQAVLVARSRR